jgi:hypothetical protein
MATLPVRALGNRAVACASAPLGGIKLPRPPAGALHSTNQTRAGGPKLMQIRSHTRHLSMAASPRASALSRWYRSCIGSPQIAGRNRHRTI